MKTNVTDEWNDVEMGRLLVEGGEPLSKDDFYDMVAEYGPIEYSKQQCKTKESIFDKICSFVESLVSR